MTPKSDPPTPHYFHEKCGCADCRREQTRVAKIVSDCSRVKSALERQIKITEACQERCVELEDKKSEALRTLRVVVGKVAQARQALSYDHPSVDKALSLLESALELVPNQVG